MAIARPLPTWMSKRSKSTELVKWPERLGGERATVPVDAGLGVAERNSGDEHVPTATQSQSEDAVGFKHLDEEETETLLKLHDQGLNQVEIAEQIGRHVSTVCRTLKKYRPTVNVAKALIANSALGAVQTAQNLLTAESEKVRLDAAALFLRANNLAGDHRQAQVGIQINLGSPGGSPLPTVQVLSGEELTG